MSSVFPNTFYNNNNTGNQLVNVSMLVEKPCPPIAPVMVTYFQGSPIGWNAVLVGLLSSILAILFLLTCLYYLMCRRRSYSNESSEIPTPVALVDKRGGIPVTSSSQTATTTFINEPGKETKINTYSEQGKNLTTTGNFVTGMPNMGNGHMGATGTNGLMANGIADPSELRLLQHEHH